MTESEVENIALEWLSRLGYTVTAGPDLALDGPSPERKTYDQVLLFDRLRRALRRLNPELAETAIEDAFRKLLRPPRSHDRSPQPRLPPHAGRWREVEYRRPDGSIAGAQARGGRLRRPRGNDWLAVNQFTVVEDKHNRRPDIVLFVNGLPLAVIELKNPADENATIWTAFQQLQTYKAEIPSLFAYNEAAGGLRRRGRREWAR